MATPTHFRIRLYPDASGVQGIQLIIGALDRERLAFDTETSLASNRNIKFDSGTTELTPYRFERELRHTMRMFPEYVGDVLYSAKSIITMENVVPKERQALLNIIETLRKEVVDQSLLKASTCKTDVYKMPKLLLKYALHENYPKEIRAVKKDETQL